MKLKELQEKRGSLVKAARDLIDSAKTEDGEVRALTADEKEKLSKLEADADGLNETIDAEMRQIARESQNRPQLSRGEQRDVEKFDIAKVLRHMDRAFRGQPSQLDGIEAEMLQQGESEAREARLDTRGIMLPEVIVAGFEKRDLSVTGGTTTQFGGELVATEKNGLLGDFYNASVLAANGAMVMRGLQGNVDFPRMTKASDPTKKAENANADELSPTFTSLSLSPKRLPAYIDISDQLLAQSSAVLEPFLRRELTNQLLDVQEVALFHGGGTNEPTGIAGTSGIGSVVGGTNGAAPDWADIIDLETAVSNNNAASGRLAYFTNSSVRGKLKQTPRIASTDSRFIWEGTEVNGYNTAVTNAIKSTLDKGTSTGVCSAIFFGNAADFVIGYWGGIMLEMVNDTTSAIAGQRRLVANTYYDGGVLRPKSWAAMLDALTA